MANMKHFSDYNGATVEVKNTYPISDVEFSTMFPGVKGMRYDSFSKRVARVGLTVVPLTRCVEYKQNPSKHECNAKCMGGSAKGTCECRCGGANHGVASVK